MGANTFETVGRGKTAQAAFTAAKSHAQWERGHGGYTGTIAEKHCFEVIDVPAGQEPREFAARLQLLQRVLSQRWQLLRMRRRRLYLLERQKR